ncbi:phytanoyl-CoA dioxygenase family protein [Hwanghaeella sp.]|uniref:phytanoyl-CoA dioxygenase family protein n=1 Tax=Hwanghaeella sp. TaxID=2605943 RepID=UPI003CCBC384
MERFTLTDGVTDTMRAAYDRDGFLVVEGLVLPDECRSLSARIDDLIAGYQAPDNPTVFGAHAADRYFLESGDDIRFFFEPDAVDKSGRPNRAIGTALNKIGHALHDLDPRFNAFFRSAAFRILAEGLDLNDPRLLQSMVIFKQPGIGAPVGMHQDASFLRTDPPSVTGFWIALEDATLDNGCLLAILGGHRGPLRKWFGRVDGDVLETRVLDEGGEAARPVPLEVPAGTLVVLHGLLPHASGPNRSQRSRRALTLHTIDGTLPYPEDNWLRRRADMPLRGFE